MTELIPLFVREQVLFGVGRGRETPTKGKLGTWTQSPLPSFVICPCVKMAAGRRCSFF